MKRSAEEIESLVHYLLVHDEYDSEDKFPRIIEILRNQTTDAEPEELTERVAVLTAHRACCGSEHDPSVGKFHGCCVVCGVDWPCKYAGKPTSVPCELSAVGYGSAGDLPSADSVDPKQAALLELTRPSGDCWEWELCKTCESVVRSTLEVHK